MLIGILLSLSFFNRIVYWIPCLIILMIYPRAITGFLTGIILMSSLINPIPMIENNFKMLHVPAYPLDYILLAVIPVMLWLNNCSHTVSEPLEMICENGNEYRIYKCCKCKKVYKTKILNASYG